MISGQAFWVGNDEVAMSSRFPSSTPGWGLYPFAERMSPGEIMKLERIVPALSSEDWKL
jgi:hypothetical protein